MDPDQLAKAFVEHYYSTFDTNRNGLGNLYQDASMLTFEGQKIQGSQNIVAKLTALPFQQCQHNISTVDCQPSGPAGGMLVFVSGNLQLAGEQHPLKFSQGFSIQRPLLRRTTETKKKEKKMMMILMIQRMGILGTVIRAQLQLLLLGWKNGDNREGTLL